MSNPLFVTLNQYLQLIQLKFITETSKDITRISYNNYRLVVRGLKQYSTSRGTTVVVAFYNSLKCGALYFEERRVVSRTLQTISSLQEEPTIFQGKQCISLKIT